MVVLGAGTQSSPIAVDDSEEEVIQELYKHSNRSSPSPGSPYSWSSIHVDRRQHLPSPPPLWIRAPEGQPMHSDKKRKRSNSLTGQDMPMAGSSYPPVYQHSLERRLSQPESKKARKRKRRAQRQAQEEADWLNNPSNFASGPVQMQTFPNTMPFHSWSNGSQNSIGDSQPISRRLPGYENPRMKASSPPRLPFVPFEGYIEQLEDLPFYKRQGPHTASPSLTPPPTSSDWVSSMALAAASSADGSIEYYDEPPKWPPMSNMLPLLPSTLPVPPTLLPMISLPPLLQPMAADPSTTLKSMEHHALPPKPPPAQAVPIIGMKPDQDPNSKHGIFQINSSTKEGGTDMKKKPKIYIPNPARTLVMEQLPKTHRNPDFINNWSRTACGALPVHLFIDGSAGKCLVEFATAELARKAWASPKLGSAFAGLKPHQLKGKPREDLIKVWWYRVDGVGAGSGVGEIEEGEIEGDLWEMERETEVAVDEPEPSRKETKKERKARLAKEREGKRLKRELELRVVNERQVAQQPPLQPQVQPVSAPLDSSLRRGGPRSPVLPATQAVGQAAALNSMAAPFVPNQTFTTIDINGDFMNQVNYQHSTIHPQPSNGPPVYSWTQYTRPPLPLPNSNRPTNGHSANSDKYAYGSSLSVGDVGGHDDRESIASSGGRSPSPDPNLYGHDHTDDRSKLSSNSAPRSIVASTNGQADDLADYEEVDMDMDVDMDVLDPYPIPSIRMTASTQQTGKPTLPAKPPVFHSSLPPRPSSTILAPHPRVAAQKSTLPPPPLLPPAAPPPSASNGATTLQVIPNSVLSTTASSSSSSSSTPVPSEPRAMKNAPKQPSFTKRALVARQKELEERIAKSKVELAEASAIAATASGTSTPITPIVSSSIRPSMDLGEKQAMEDRLRKLVLQSQRARGKTGTSVASEASSLSMNATATQVSSIVPSSSSSAPISTIPHKPTTAPRPHQHQHQPLPAKPNSIAVSLHASSISLEDLADAESFITQTIVETIESHRASVPASVAGATGSSAELSTLVPPSTKATPSASASVSASALVSTSASTSTFTAQSVNTNSNTRLELAAKHKRLEQHINESKALMAQLSQAKTKQEKDSILKVMRTKSRLFEEGSQATAPIQPTTSSSKAVYYASTSTTTSANGDHSSMMTMSHNQSFKNMWPETQEDAGVFDLSDDEVDGSDED